MIFSSFSLIAFGPMRDQQSPETIMLGVWTLYHGVLLYLVFGLIILSKRIGFTVLALWLAGSPFMLRYPNDVSLASFYFGPLHLLFGLGMGAAALVLYRMIAFPRILIVLGGVLCGGIVAREVGATSRRVSRRFSCSGLEALPPLSALSQWTLTDGYASAQYCAFSEMLLMRSFWCTILC